MTERIVLIVQRQYEDNEIKQASKVFEPELLTMRTNADAGTLLLWYIEDMRKSLDKHEKESQ